MGTFSAIDLALYGLFRSGAYADIPLAADVQIGTIYDDTTNGCTWRCRLIGGVPTWWSDMKGSAQITSQATLTTTIAWDTWIATTWRTSFLVGMTFLDGVFTITGPPQVRNINMKLIQTCGTAQNMPFGISVNGATPEVAHRQTCYTYGSQARQAIAHARVLLSPGDTITVQSLTGVAGQSLFISPGSTLAID